MEVDGNSATSQGLRTAGDTQMTVGSVVWCGSCHGQVCSELKMPFQFSAGRTSVDERALGGPARTEVRRVESLL